MSAGYDDDLLAHARRPAGAGTLPGSSRHGRAENAMCGDEIEIDVRVDQGRVTEIAHRTRGCAFTLASASVLARSVPGLTVAEALARASGLRRALAGTVALVPELEPLASVRMYPARIRCALLPWDALDAALGSEFRSPR